VVTGVAPHVLFEQVRGTAAWALEGPISGATSFRAVMKDVDGAAHAHAQDPPGLAYFRALLAAHFCTVATFVPTDVDARIRHHTFVPLSEEDLTLACDVIDEAAAWDVALVSARVVAGVSGHDGEWLAVRAGALGRALVLGAEGLASRLASNIDDELARELGILASLARGDGIDWLRAVTTIAHNLGDLSRVVEAWPDKSAHAGLRAQYTRLGHGPSPRFGDAFAQAGATNKSVMADENHRFLALRKPRALRVSRDLLLPIGPFFDGWGRAVATHAALEATDRAEIVTALLSIHLAKPSSRGCLRALAGIDASTSRGLAAFESLLPARMRKLLSSGPVRDAVKTREDVFLARMQNIRLRA
jgi:hypothetical protein